MRLVKFIFDTDDMGNECGLAVEFKADDLKNVDYSVRNAVRMSKHGKHFDPVETANALRELARWCETLHYNTKKED